MAEALNRPSEETAPEPAPEVEARRSAVRRPHGGRFLLAYALLASLLAAGAVAFAVVATRPQRSQQPEAPRVAFAQWHPSATGRDAAQEIADFVSQRYKLPSRRQLAAVRAGPLEIEKVPISAVAVQSGREGGNVKFTVTLVQNGVLYAICGLGRRCSIAEGKPSEERGRLVRREALELALYTFAYIPDVDAVAAFLPPSAASPTSFIVFFHRRDLQPLLERPLRETLPEETPPLPAQIDPFEATVIDRLTVPHVFGFGVQQLQDGTAILVLAPPGSGS